MFDWGKLIWFLACGSAVLLFLRLVANGIQHVQVELEAFERHEKRVRDRRSADAAAEEPTDPGPINRAPRTRAFRS